MRARLFVANSNLVTKMTQEREAGRRKHNDHRRVKKSVMQVLHVRRSMHRSRVSIRRH